MSLKKSVPFRVIEVSYAPLKSIKTQTFPIMFVYEILSFDSFVELMISMLHSKNEKPSSATHAGVCCCFACSLSNATIFFFSFLFCECLLVFFTEAESARKSNECRDMLNGEISILHLHYAKMWSHYAVTSFSVWFIFILCIQNERKFM